MATDTRLSRQSLVVARKELLELLRDRRTLISTILIPVLAMPLLLGGMAWMARNQISRLQESTVDMVLRGSEHAAGLEQVVQSIERLAPVADPDPALPVDSLLLGQGIPLVIEFQPGLPGAFERLEEEQDEAEEVPSVVIHYKSTDDEAQLALDELTRTLTDHRAEQVSEWLRVRGIRPDAVRPWTVLRSDRAPEEQRRAEMLARFLPYMILLLVVQSLTYPAMELTAGEKERHTIETLLVNPVSRSSLALGKFMAIAAMGVGSALITLGSQLGFVMLLADRMGLREQIRIELDPAAAALTLVFLLPFTFFFAGLMLVVCLHARSMKEAQSYVAPMIMLVIFPSMMSLIPGLELDWKGALIPVYNMTLVMRDVLMQDGAGTGTMALVFLANTVYAGLALAAASWMFRREGVIFRS